MIVVVDFGSQTAHLIARRVRDLGVYSEIVSHKVGIRELKKKKNLQGIIFSGGPASIYEKGLPKIDKKIFDLKIPILGICYGMQLMAYYLGGRVKSGSEKEYGGVEVKLKKNLLFNQLKSKQKVWMSHGDQVMKLAKGFVSLGKSKGTKHIGMVNMQKKFYAIQFHPEVEHTVNGRKILANFVFDICNCKKNWDKKKFLKEQVEEIKERVGDFRVICGLSGGVDSSTAAAIVYKAIGKQLKCVYVDNGLMRWKESEQVIKDFKKYFGRSLIVVRAEKQFLRALKGIEDPEEKRKTIGELFIRIFEKQAKKLGKVKFLVQGTIYPDVIESAKKHDPAVVIKSHHNVGGLPEKMGLKLIEPLRELYKDEVRKIGKKIGLPESIVWRQPFPGPGLAIRIRGKVTKLRLDRLRLADKILQEEVAKFDLGKEIWMTLAIYVPLKTTGVKGDGRSFEEMIAIRSIVSSDTMTSDWTRLPYDLLAIVSSRIVNEVGGINRVVYDITSKPPATMEWE